MHVYCMETTINTKDKDGTWLQKHCKAWLETITLVFIFFLPIFCTISIIYKLLNSLPFNFGRELYTSSVMSNEQPIPCNTTSLTLTREGWEDGEEYTAVRLHGLSFSKHLRIESSHLRLPGHIEPRWLRKNMHVISYNYLHI